MTSEKGGRNLDIFLTVMHLAVITGDRFCTDFAHLKQACLHDTYCMSYIIRRTEVIKRRLYRFKYGFLTKMHRFATGGIYSPPGAVWCIYIYIYAVSRRFYPKRLTVHSGYTFVLSVCVFPGNRTHNLCAVNAMLYLTTFDLLNTTTQPYFYRAWKSQNNFLYNSHWIHLK